MSGESIVALRVRCAFVRLCVCVRPLLHIIQTL
jgi:hypothetical protein